MKAGAFTPAIQAEGRPRERASYTLNEGGGFHPAILHDLKRANQDQRPLNEGGGFHPRNPTGQRGRSAHWSSLNEGGGFHPRNPPYDEHDNDTLINRSMKAGAFTPAIRWTRGYPHEEGGGAQ